MEIEALDRLWQKEDPWRLLKRICHFSDI